MKLEPTIGTAHEECSDAAWSDGRHRHLSMHLSLWFCLECCINLIGELLLLADGLLR